MRYNAINDLLFHDGPMIQAETFRVSFLFMLTKRINSDPAVYVTPGSLVHFTKSFGSIRLASLVPEAAGVLICDAPGSGNPFAVVLATLVGVPMYAGIFGTIPIAEALFAKGVGAGTIMSFMMAVTALSLPSLVMLSKVVKPKLLGTFVAVITVGIVLIGYLFNWLTPLLA